MSFYFWAQLIGIEIKEQIWIYILVGTVSSDLDKIGAKLIYKLF